jgi:cysteine-rich repeat protein
VGAGGYALDPVDKRETAELKTAGVWIHLGSQAGRTAKSFLALPTLFELTAAIAALMLLALPAGVADGKTITEIIDPNGDGEGNTLDAAMAVAVDASRNVYVTGGNSKNAFKIDPNGLITEIIDSTGDRVHANSGSDALALYVSANVYVAGTYPEDNVFKIDPNGVITQIIDSTGDGAGNSLDLPDDLAVDTTGNLYVTGRGSYNAFKIDPNGLITEIIDSTGDGAGNTLSSARGIALDSAANVYVSGSSNNVFKITPGGVITQILDPNGDGVHHFDCYVTGFCDLAVDPSDNVYVTGTGSDNAFKIDPNGLITEIIDSTGDGTNWLGFPVAITTDLVGNVYVAGGNVFRIDPSGVISLVLSANNPIVKLFLGLATDTTGALYVTGAATHNAVKITFDCGDGSLDPGEQCDDGNTDPCDGCSDTCQNETGWVCGDGTLNATCGEQCDDGNTDPGDGCDENCQVEFEGCPATPQSTCSSPGKSILIIKDQDPSGPSMKDKLVWKWLKGPATSQGDFGDPTDPNGVDYKLCFYTGSTPVLAMQAQVPSGPGWSAISSKGYKYINRDKSSDGIMKMMLKGGDTGKSKAMVLGKDANLPLLTLPLDLNADVIAQLSNNDPNGNCWEESFSQANVIKNTSVLFKAKKP